jgi:hypothetical protein
MKNHNEFHLIEEIIALSVATTWDPAKIEWELERIVRLDAEDGDTPETCLCSHSPIMELCYLRNTKNGSEALVGNVCVTKFLGLNSELLFACANRIAEDDDKAQNIETIDYGRQHGWYSDWEYGFLVDTIRKRTLSPKQAARRRDLNDRLLTNLNYHHPNLTARREQIAVATLKPLQHPKTVTLKPSMIASFDSPFHHRTSMVTAMLSTSMVGTSTLFSAIPSCCGAMIRSRCPLGA